MPHPRVTTESNASCVRQVHGEMMGVRCARAVLRIKFRVVNAIGVVAIVTQYMAVTEEDLKGATPDVVVWSGAHRQPSVVHFTAKVLVQSLLMLHEYLNFSQF